MMYLLTSTKLLDFYSPTVVSSSLSLSLLSSSMVPPSTTLELVLLFLAGASELLSESESGWAQLWKVWEAMDLLEDLVLLEGGASSWTWTWTS